MSGEPQERIDNLAPGLLIAMPGLVDPNFFRSVVLVCAHSEEGAFGLVLNHPLDITIAEVCNEAEVAWTGTGSERAFSGGPVERQRGWLVHESSRQFAGTQPVGEGLALSASQDALAAYGHEPTGRFRLMLGYAGWAPGQLEREIRQGSWLFAPATTRIVFEIAPGRAWREALLSVGVDPTHLVDGSSVLN